MFQDLTLQTPIADETGKKLAAIKVFSKSIECLKKHLKDLLSEKKVVLKDNEALWVLTVPAIWDDTAKGFMRKAAKDVSLCIFHLFLLPQNVIKLGRPKIDYLVS